ncbi:hypothetical protein JCM8097_006231 [Rhodosporidiobolus ruineniae]
MTPRTRSQGAALAPTTPEAVVGTPKARRRKTARLKAPKKEDDDALTVKQEERDGEPRFSSSVRPKAPSPALKEDETASAVKEEDEEDAKDPALFAATARERAPSPAIKTEEDAARSFSSRFDSSRLPDEALAHILSSPSLAKRDLAAVCLVSRRFRDLVQPIMYRSLTIYIVDHAAHGINEAVMTDDPSSRLLLKRTLQDSKLAGLVRSVDFQLKSQDWPLDEGDHGARRRWQRYLSNRLFDEKPKEDENDADGMHVDWEEGDFEEALAERTTMWPEDFDNIFSSFARRIEHLPNLARLHFRIGKHGDGFSKFWETVGKLQHLTHLYLDPVLDENHDFPFSLANPTRFTALQRLELDAAHDEGSAGAYRRDFDCGPTLSGQAPAGFVALQRDCRHRGVDLAVRSRWEWGDNWQEKLGLAADEAIEELGQEEEEQYGLQAEWEQEEDEP